MMEGFATIEDPLVVTESAQRPAGRAGECFYCQKPVGVRHDHDCPLVVKKVVIRMTVTYEAVVPASWDEHQIEFHRNDGSWCADNAMDELEGVIERDGCLCSATKFEVVEIPNEPPFLQEK